MRTDRAAIMDTQSSNVWQTGMAGREDGRKTLFQCLDRQDDISIEVGQRESLELLRHKTEAFLVRRPRELAMMSLKHEARTE